MSEYGVDDSPPQLGSEAPLHNLSVDDPTNAANNSIIGKVKSRVSSILPNRLSKWFSPSTKLRTDEINGDVAATNKARRRRRIEVDDEEEDDDNYDDDETRRGEYEENHNLMSKQEENSEADDDDDDEDDDDGSQNSEEDYNPPLAAQKTRHDILGRQPPAKRSRLNVDMRDSPSIAPRRPLVASTPAVGSTYSRNSIGTATTVSRSSYQRFTNLNLYGSQSRKEPAYNFSQQTDSGSPKINTDIIDLISNPPNEMVDKFVTQSNAYSRAGISSRRSLNIPSSSSTRPVAERVLATVSHLKRQSLATANKTDLSSSVTLGVPPRRTSTTIHEVKDPIEHSEFGEQEEDEDAIENNLLMHNGQMTEETTNSYKRIKRQKQINGSGLNVPDIPEANEAILIDTASESGESGTAELTKSKPERKTGLFNTSVAGTGTGTTRNSSRTSSFGNGLNFYSHLEGRKSLFTGPGHGISNPLNNSTLSLTSLNRRQFNASIYGSTSALSDSRLLNTFSPFYKGKTTYGGAAAYNKYTAGAGASAVRITPTLIRPTSSLSTLSSSNNSLATNANSQQIGESSTISSTAKRILDLINDFATPLSEAKKMASNLKANANLQMPPHAMGRLNESDLNASRAMRLSQVRTPYSRPAVILQPSGNANGRGMIGGPLPPVKELQVPTMSQLLQMKKIQNTTEKARNITRNTTSNSEGSEYTLPTISTDISKPPSGGTASEQLQHQQKHTNKIKNKVSSTVRASAASKDLLDEAPPASVNLPNIAFPLMQSVPRFDIQFSTTSTTATSATTSATGGSTKKSFASSPTIQTAFNKKPISTTRMPATSDSNIKLATPNPCTSTTVNFKFSEPLVVKGVNTPTQNITPTNFNNYKFSPPVDVTLSMTPTTSQSKPQQPQLKTGSCLDVLSKPFSLPQSAPKTEESSSTLSANSFGNQFKKSSNEWECDACMIRNKAVASKCVACETPRKQAVGNSTSCSLTSNTSLPVSSSTFGLQFKKSSAEWECDTCMIRNKEGDTKCVACVTPRKGLVASTNSLPLPPIKNSFGDAFKTKSGTWECSTCLISNKNEANECVACQTKKPGYTDSSKTAGAAMTSSFKFGFASAQTTPAATTSDDGFKTIAAQQKVSKWECDACMTRNDAERTKCACCEQPKPGSSTTETSSSTSTKFTFGATAAAKFSFGFGPGSNAPKEEELRKDNSTKSDEVKMTTPTVTTSNTLPATSFQFGIKPKISVTEESKKDETDAKKNQSSVSSSAVGGFQFGVSDAAKKPEAPSATLATTTGFTFGTKSTDAASKTSSTTAVNSPSVKFSLPSSTVTASSTTTTSSGDKPTGIAAPTFSFGSNTASSTTEGFAFGNAAKKPASAGEEKKALGGFAFKAPAAVSSSTTNNVAGTPTAGFVFGSAATANNKNPSPTITQPTTNSTSNTTSSSTTVVTTATATVKPMFSFGSSAAAAAAVPATTTSGGFGGFSFGSGSTPTATTTAGKSLFGAVTSTSATTTTSASSNSSTKPAATTNLFGSFGGITSATPTFGSSPAATTANPANANNSTTVSSSTNSSNNTTANATPTFGSFGSANQTTTTNVFGSFGGSSQINQTQNKPTAPVFGNVASSSNTQAPPSKSFVFGSAPNTSTPAAATVSTASATASVSSGASTSWSKNSFVFGSAASTQATQSANAANKDVPKASVFGAFGGGGGHNSNLQTTSIFGNPAPSASNTTSPPPPAFGNTASATNSSTNLFGVNSAPAPTTNIFGANPSGNAVTPAPAFGSSPFGGSASSTSATPTFGSTAVTGSATFGGFGAASAVGNTTNVTEIKKPEPAFNFGSAPATQQTSSGGFNFGSTSAPTKPAFNFGGTGAPQPTFNFTGSTESQNSAKPFQFGAIPSAPVFNFGGGAIEATPNAPFQFNAGTAPVSSNIFAPAPTPGAQTAQQAKRKIRAPIRRVTQR